MAELIRAGEKAARPAVAGEAFLDPDIAIAGKVARRLQGA